MRLRKTIAAHARCAAIKYGAVQGVVGPFTPVPVRLVTLIPAFVAQGLLIRPGEVTMPGEEVCCAMNEKSLVDVHCDEVVEAGLGAWDFCSVIDGRLGHQTFHCVGVCDLLGGREVAPALMLT